MNQHTFFSESRLLHREYDLLIFVSVSNKAMEIRFSMCLSDDSNSRKASKLAMKSIFDFLRVDLVYRSMEQKTHHLDILLFSSLNMNLNSP